MPADRYLIVNADDLGMSPGVTAGILEAHTHGIVTSASLMVRRQDAGDAAQLAAAHPRLAVGLHIDLGEWEYVQGEWRATYARCDTGHSAAVAAECRAQLDAFRGLVGRDPTHLDSHQHVHDSEPAAAAAVALAAELGVPLRGHAVRFEGGFYGQNGKGVPYPEGVAPGHLAALIAGLPEGWTEIGCHPGTGAGLQSSYGAERELELRTLCDPAVSSAIRDARVRLRSFADYTAECVGSG